jgi:ADP-ribose pyrophosphatase YjhB (NUDIX family)
MIRIRIGMPKNKSGANVILIKNGKILLLLRSDKSRWMPGVYGPPGGHIDPANLQSRQQ